MSAAINRKRRRSNVEWMGASFLSRTITGLFPIGTLLAVQGLAGGGTMVLVFLLFATAAGLNSVFGGTYFLRKGVVPKRTDEQGGEKRRWRDRMKYPGELYTPSGTGQAKRYRRSVNIALMCDQLEWAMDILLVQQGLPISIGVFLAWASGCWLAIGRGFCVWPNLRFHAVKALAATLAGKATEPMPGVGAQVRHLFAGPRWDRLALAAIGVFSLMGTAVASGLVSSRGVDVELASNPVVWILLAKSLVVAWLVAYNKRTRLLEEAAFRETVGVLSVDDHLFLSAKLGFWQSLATFGWCVLFFAIYGLLDGFPHVAHQGPVLGFLGLYLVGSLGNRLGNVARGEGDPALNGIGATGAVAFSFLWAWAFQGIATQPLQFAGAAMVFVGAAVSVFITRDDRARMMGLLRRRRGGSR